MDQNDCRAAELTGDYSLSFHDDAGELVGYFGVVDGKVVAGGEVEARELFELVCGGLPLA